jgi:hypothetical protein
MKTKLYFGFSDNVAKYKDEKGDLHYCKKDHPKYEQIKAKIIECIKLMEVK